MFDDVTDFKSPLYELLFSYIRQRYLLFVGRVYLNRQVIVLMSGLGVRHQAFFALQDNMLQQLAGMLIRENLAIDALVQVLFPP